MKFVLAGNGSYGNRGCEAIVRGTIRILENAFPNIYIDNCYFPSEIPDHKAGTWDKNITYLPLERKGPTKKISSLGWWNYRIHTLLDSDFSRTYRLRNLMKSTSDSEAVLMVGGDNYSLDYGRPDIFFAMNEYVINSRKPLIIWGGSVGPFSKDPSYEEWAIKQLKTVDRIYAREPATVEYLESKGVIENVVHVADPAFAMEPELMQYPEKFLTMFDRDAIGINISPLLAQFRPDQSICSWVNQCKEIILGILKNFDNPVILVPHVMYPSKNIQSDDYIFLNTILEQLPDCYKSRVAIIDRNLNAAQIKGIISKLKIFIGARTHSTIASLSSAIPTLILGYSMKSAGITKDIYKDEQYLISLPELTPEIIRSKTESLLQNYEEIRSGLLLRLSDLYSKAFSAGIDLHRFLSNRK